MVAPCTNHTHPQRPHQHRSADTPRRPGWLARLGGWCFDHRLAAVGLWLFALVVVFGAVGAVGPAYEDAFDVPGSDSAEGFAVLEEHFADLGTGGQSGTIVFRAEQGVDDPQVIAAMEELFSSWTPASPTPRRPPHPGATVVSPYSATAPARSPGAGRSPTTWRTPR